MMREALDPLHPRPAPNDQFTPQILRSLQEGCPLTASEDYALLLNSLQISQSSRFLYSCEDDFDLVREAIGRDQREGDGLLSVSRHSPSLVARPAAKMLTRQLHVMVVGHRRLSAHCPPAPVQLPALST
jgi:hypothetical protein